MKATQHLYDAFFSNTAPVRMSYDGAPVCLTEGWAVETIDTPDYLLEKRSYCPDETLKITLEIRRYHRHPVAEWGFVLENNSNYASRLVSDVDIANVHFLFDPAAITPVFLEMAGSNEQLNDFRFLRTQMFHNARRELKCFGGRSSSHMAPYFNMILDKIGYIMAIGWSGQWNATAWRTNDDGYVDFRARMEDCEFIVLPGEKLELPTMLICEWTGKEEDGYNVYRRFALDHIVPKQPNGKPIELLNCLYGWGGDGAETNLKRIDRLLAHNLKPECFWIDAGWYGDENSIDVSNDHYAGCWWRYVSINDWNPCPLHYPDGMQPIADKLHDAGINFLLWYEPERARSETKRISEHPDWYIGYLRPDDNMMFNLGNDEAREWLTERLAEDIEKYHLRVLRIDFNFAPLSFWRMNDAPNRKGVTEIKYNRGLYKMWGDLLQRFPNLTIDNCASGGRRLDYAALRYSIPYFRTDYACFPDALDEGYQLQTYGLNHFLPVNGTTDIAVSPMTPVGRYDEAVYSTRSRMSSGYMLNVPPEDAPEELYAWTAKMLNQQARMRPYTYGDFYALTGANDDPKSWIAWQFNRPEEGDGMVVAFRRSESPLRAADFELRGVDPEAMYVIEDIDTGAKTEVCGKVLAESFTVELAKKKSSAVLFYTKK